ncbi:MAG: DUF1588 domain-containing protein, partial [Myxococcales bacterium]|nr:DUF1588 domain-containing protein [Myxococcales bacterium]
DDAVGEIGDPNQLDQDRLFTCDPSVLTSSPARIRRLTPGQFGQRFVPSPGPAPYASDEAYRFSTDGRDVRLDPAAVDGIVRKALQLGRDDAVKKIGWVNCARIAEELPAKSCLDEWAERHLKRAWQRDPLPEEVQELSAYAEAKIKKYGVDEGFVLAGARVFASPEFLFKQELGSIPVEGNRRQLGSWPMARAIASLVTDSPLVHFYHTPRLDEPLNAALEELRVAAETDALQTREQVETHIRALLEVAVPRDKYDGLLRLPSRVGGFFNEWLGHTRAPEVFKNGGDTPRGEQPYIFYNAGALPTSMNEMIATIYVENRDFLESLLTTRAFVVTTEKNDHAWPYNLADGNDATDEMLVPGVFELPKNERAGLLTHPAWLVAHSTNQPTDPHPVHRGKWIRENLLCGAVPEIPVEVEAQLPQTATARVRDRLEAATGPGQQQGYCWGCHQYMDPLGIPFEMYDHYGRFRTDEFVGDGSLVPVDASSTLVATGDPDLDGVVVEDAVDLVEHLASSPRVEGCFVRQVFRYFVGRPETYEDACVLDSMRTAYRQQDGSFQAMLVALGTSDAFLYRHSPTDKEVQP